MVLLGPPGAGKGTQAARLAQRLDLAHISLGAILREEARSASPRGSRIAALLRAGELVDDELANELVRRRLESLPPEKGFVLDGYPRTAGEARALRAALERLGRMTPRPLVVWLEVPREEVIERMRDRRVREERSDDAEETIAHRLQVHEQQQSTLREALDGWTDQATVDGRQPSDRVTDEILEILARRGAGVLGS